MLETRIMKVTERTQYAHRLVISSSSWPARYGVILSDSNNITMASSSGRKPTLLILHGAWHTPQHFQPLTEKLKSLGYTTSVPSLAFGDPVTPSPSIVATIDQVAAQLVSLTRENHVVVIAHSFGGVSGGSAVKGMTYKNSSRLPADSQYRVLGMVHLASMLYPPQGMGDARIENVHCSSGEDGYEVLDKTPPKELFYGELPDNEAEKWVDILGKVSTACMIGPKALDGFTPGYLDLPNWYLICTKDRAIPVEFQRFMANNIASNGGTVECRDIETDHSPYLSRIDDTVRFIQEALHAFSAET